ncbi:MAG: ATP-binding protein [Myxococcota bacterium]
MSSNDDLKAIRTILEQLASDAGQTIGDVAHPVALGQLMDEALEPFAQRQVQLTLPDTLRERDVRVPGRTFAHALRSVVKNALEASAEGEAVQVDVMVEDDRLAIQVADQGIGMSPEVLARATEPFFSTKPTGKGMGLGLFVSRSVADALGGRFVLDSQLGQGTLARFELPLT